MFCPVCWKEYPKGMRHCDSCRAELIEEKPGEHESHEHPEKPETGKAKAEDKPQPKT